MPSFSFNRVVVPLPLGKQLLFQQHVPHLQCSFSSVGNFMLLVSDLIVDSLLLTLQKSSGIGSALVQNINKYLSLA